MRNCTSTGSFQSIIAACTPWITTVLLMVLVVGLVVHPATPPVMAAGFVVNNTVDGSDQNPGDGLCEAEDGTCTLRAAMQEAVASPGDDTITLSAGRYVLTESELDVYGTTDMLTIIGADPAETIIEQDAENERILGVYAEATVIFRDMTLLGGHKTEPGDAGGAISNSGGTITLENIVLTENTADFGGAVYNQGTLTLIDSVFSKNQARSGGAIYTPTQTVLSLENVTIINNRANDHGGAIYAEGGAAVTIEQSLFRANRALGGNGGAINMGGNLTISGSTFDFNTAQAAGGAFYIEPGAEVTITTSDIQDNVAYHESGGGIYNLGDTKIREVRIRRNEVRTKSGGGIYNEGVLTIEQSDISQNRAITPDDTMTTADGLLTKSQPGVSYFGNGSGGGVGNDLGGSVDIRTSTIRDNKSIFEGAGLYSRGTGSSISADSIIVSGNNLSGAWSTYYIEPEKHRWLGEGGAVFNEAEMDLSNCYIVDNFAGGNGGGISNKSSIRVQDCLIARNQAGYGEDENDKRIGDGGGFNNYYGSLTSSADIKRTVITQNRATVQGGGVYNMSGIINLEESAVTNNEAVSNGGGVYTTVRQGWWRGRLNLRNVTISGNRAGVHGGGLANENTTAGSAEQSWVRLTNVTIAQNQANVGTGGGIYNSHDAGGEQQSWIQNSIVSDNRAGSQANQCGGPVFLTSLGAMVTSDNSCQEWFTNETDAHSADPQLGDLADSPTSGGYPTLLQPLLSESSPANDRANDGCPENDQRLFSRSQPCDSGAAELVSTALTIEPLELNFDSQMINTPSAPQSLTLQNTASGRDITITNVVTSSDSFTIDASNCGDDIPFTLSGGASCQLNVIFTPSMIGAEVRPLIIKTDDTLSEQGIRLVGSGAREEFLSPGLVPGATSPWLRITPDPVTFSGQNIGTSSPPQNITLQNIGTQPLQVSKVSTDGDFALGNGSCGAVPFTIPPGGKCTLTATFTPSDAGAIIEKVFVESNAPSSPDEAQLQGLGIQAWTSLIPEPLAFGTQRVNTSETLPVQLQNLGSANLVIEAITISKPEFTVVPTCQDAPGFPVTVPAGGRCILDVTFTPTTTDDIVATLSLKSNATGGAQEMTLTGKGTNTVGIDLTPGTILFPEQLINTHADKVSVTLTNHGTTAATITDLDMTSPEFPISFADCNADETLPFSLEPGASCNILVDFLPAGVRWRSGTLRVASPQGTDTIFFTGPSVGPFPETDPPILDFGATLMAGTSVERPLTIVNRGTEPINVDSLTVANENGKVAILSGMDARSKVAENDGEFAIVNGDTCDPSGSFTIAIGGKCTLTIAFTPKQAGQRIANLLLKSDATAQPYPIKVRGMGIEPGKIPVPGTPAFALTIARATNPAEPHLVEPGTLHTYRIRYENTGNAIAENTTVTLTGNEWASINRMQSAPGWVVVDALTATFRIGDVAPGESGELLVVMAFAPGIPAETTMPITVTLQSAAPDAYVVSAQESAQTTAATASKPIDPPPPPDFIIYLPLLNS